MDLIATVLLGLLALAAAGAVLFTSPFLVMASDSAGEKPRTAMLGLAFLVTWGGVGAGLIGGGVGAFRAAKNGATMWIWPALAIAVIGACFLLGGWLATKVVRR